jgi:hypothetical protein
MEEYFNVKFLTKYLFEGESCYVLALSPQNTFLYKKEDSNFTLIPESEYLPEDMESALWMKEGEKSIQHSTTRPIDKSGSGGMTFHGHGAYKDGRETWFIRYLQKIDNSISRLLDVYQVPLVVIATEEIFLLYKQINTYPNLVKDYVKGNPDDGEERKKLLNKVEPLIKKMIKKKKKEVVKNAKDTYEDNLNDPGDIVRASYFGRVDTLLLTSLKDRWGKFRLHDVTIKKHRKERKESQDILNLAVLMTIKNDGKVYILDREDFKIRKKYTAVLRY